MPFIWNDMSEIQNSTILCHVPVNFMNSDEFCPKIHNINMIVRWHNIVHQFLLVINSVHFAFSEKHHVLKTPCTHYAFGDQPENSERLSLTCWFFWQFALPSFRIYQMQKFISFSTSVNTFPLPLLTIASDMKLDCLLNLPL